MFIVHGFVLDLDILTDQRSFGFLTIQEVSMSTLPQDLIDHIIDLVARTVGSSPDLIACSLVSKSFRYRCTKHLFSTIHLSYFRHFDTRRDSPLQKYPTISPYIEHLILTVSSILEELIQRSSLPSVTEMISPLRSFTLIGIPTLPSLLLDWEVVSIALDKRRQISNPLLSSKLTTLCLEDVRNVSPTLFSICINLTSITFKNVELQPSSSHEQRTLSEVETGKLSRPRLLVLKLLSFSRENLLERLFPPQAPPLVDLNGLRSLTIRPGIDYKEEDMVAVRELMAISKDTLHRLSWYHWQFIPPGAFFDTTQVTVYLLTDVQARFGLQPPPPAVDFTLFPALRMLEIPLIVDILGDSLRSVCSVLATIFNSSITLEMLIISIQLDGEVDGVDGEETEDDDDNEETEDDDDTEETEDDTGYVPRILLKYSGLKWRRLVNVLLGTSRSRSGISEPNPIARHILFDFWYPGPDYELTQECREKHRFNWEKSISALVKKEFSKLVRGGDAFKFEYYSRDSGGRGGFDPLRMYIGWQYFGSARRDC